MSAVLAWAVGVATSLIATTLITGTVVSAAIVTAPVVIPTVVTSGIIARSVVANRVTTGIIVGARREANNTRSRDTRDRQRGINGLDWTTIDIISGHTTDAGANAGNQRGQDRQP